MITTLSYQRQYDHANKSRRFHFPRWLQLKHVCQGANKPVSYHLDAIENAIPPTFAHFPLSETRFGVAHRNTKISSLLSTSVLLTRGFKLICSEVHFSKTNLSTHLLTGTISARLFGHVFDQITASSSSHISCWHLDATDVEQTSTHHSIPWFPTGSNKSTVDWVIDNES